MVTGFLLPPPPPPPPPSPLKLKGRHRGQVVKTQEQNLGIPSTVQKPSLPRVGQPWQLAMVTPPFPFLMNFLLPKAIQGLLAATWTRLYGSAWLISPLS